MNFWSKVMGLPGDIVTKPSSRVGAERLMSFRDGGSGGSGSGATHYDTTNNPTLFIETEQDRQKRMRRLQRRLTSGVVIPVRRFTAASHPFVVLFLFLYI